jgi:hypothetical protein
MSSKKKELKWLVSVDELPISPKAKKSEYDDIIKEFIDSGLKLAKINMPHFKKEKKAKAVLQSLNKRVAKGKYPIKVRERLGDIYLEKK